MRPSHKLLLFSSQEYSMISQSGLRVHVLTLSQDLVYVFGSSIVSVYAMWPISVRLNRSMVCNWSLCGCPMVSILVLPLKPMVSITSVSSSQWPTEFPNHVGSGFLGWGRPSIGVTWNQLFCSYSIAMYLSF